MNDADPLVSTFAENVAKQSRFVMLGNAEAGNACAREYIKAFQALRSMGTDGLNALAALLEDLRADVRVTAAAFLLRHCEAKAKSVLESEANGKGLTALAASQALRRWEEGTWNLDAEP